MVEIPAPQPGHHHRACRQAATANPCRVHVAAISSMSQPYATRSRENATTGRWRSATNLGRDPAAWLHHRGCHDLEQPVDEVLLPAGAVPSAARGWMSRPGPASASSGIATRSWTRRSQKSVDWRSFTCWMVEIRRWPQPSSGPPATDTNDSSTAEIPTNSATLARRHMQYVPRPQPSANTECGTCPPIPMSAIKRQQQGRAGEQHGNGAEGGDFERGQDNCARQPNIGAMRAKIAARAKIEPTMMKKRRGAGGEDLPGRDEGSRAPSPTRGRMSSFRSRWRSARAVPAE